MKPNKPKSASAAKSAKDKKKAKGTASSVKVKTSKPNKAVKKTVNKAVSKPVKKKITPKAASKSVKPVKSGKKGTPVKSVKKIVPSKKMIVKKIVKAPIKTILKATKDVKKQVAVKSVKPEKTSVVKASKGIEKEVKTKVLTKQPETTKPVVSEKPLKVKKGKGGRKPKSKNDDDEPEIINDELIEQLIQTTKRGKQPKKPKILKTFVNPMTSLIVPVSADGNKKNAGGSKKEPNGRFELEYVVRTSAGILYELLTTPSGLSEWFADDVNIRDGIFTFFWDGSDQQAKLLGFKEDKYVRLQWLDKPEGSYFEFRIEKDDLTGDISLMIVDFADEASDLQTSKLLWDSQVNKLLSVLGSN